jgi:hypothetical protein
MSLELFVSICSLTVSIASLIFVILIKFQTKSMNDQIWSYTTNISMVQIADTIKRWKEEKIDVKDLVDFWQFEYAPEYNKKDYIDKYKNAYNFMNDKIIRK